MKVRPTTEQRAAALLAAGRIEQPMSLVNLAADGTSINISDEDRDRLLAKCAANEYVKIIVEVLAYEHKANEPNRRNVRLRDGAVLSAAKTAIGRPFLRDHEQTDSLARGGTILESRGVRRGDNDYAITQRIELTAPWAVDLALRGLLTFVSIGLRATGPVLCSNCNTEVMTECWHFPGDEIGTEADGESDTCEWIYTSAEITETSAVNVPAVPGAHIEGIRAALSAVANNSGSPPQRSYMYARLAAILNLAVTAGETEVLSAVEAQGKRAKALEAELGIANSDLSAVTGERDVLKEAKLAAEAKAFIDEAVALGKIAPADVEMHTALYAADQTKAIELMAKRKPGTATPVGKPRQTPGSPGPTPGPTPGEQTLSARVDAVLAAQGTDPVIARKAAAIFGAKPDQVTKALAASLNISEEG